MVETTEEQYPDKPVSVIREKDNVMIRSVISIFLFIGLFYLVFDMSLEYIMLLVLVIFIHEMGHLIAMKRFGYHDLKMFFVPLIGALVSGKKRDISQRQKAIISLAGPVPGIIIGAVLLFLAVPVGDQKMIVAGNMFLFLNAFNLLPIDPLDGGKLIENLFFASNKVIQIVFLGLSIAASVVIGVFFNAYAFAFIAFFLILRIRNLTKVNAIRTHLMAIGVNYRKSFEELTNKEYWLARKVIINNTPVFQQINPNEYKVSKFEEQLITRVKSVLHIQPVADLSVLGKVFLMLVWATFLFGSVYTFYLLYAG